MLTVQFNGAAFSDHRGWNGFAPRRARCLLEIAAPRRRPAAAQQPRLTAGGLEAPICDGRAVRVAALAAVEADRAFSAGNCYLSGQIIDRAI